MKAKPFPQLTAKQIVSFWSHVEKGENCWVWTAACFHTGYGQVKIRPRTLLAHRVSFFLANGDISEHMTLDHICRNRRCVNPAHLEQVPLRENILRAPTSLAAINAIKTHCFRGHPYVETNWGRYHRICRICTRQSDLRFREKRRLKNEHAANASPTSVVAI